MQLPPIERTKTKVGDSGRTPVSWPRNPVTCHATSLAAAAAAAAPSHEVELTATPPWSPLPAWQAPGSQCQPASNHNDDATSRCSGGARHPPVGPAVVAAMNEFSVSGASTCGGTHACARLPVCRRRRRVLAPWRRTECCIFCVCACRQLGLLPQRVKRI